ncbi:hypothetical protein PYCCODRAFT_571040 [Trametes coccinea BRFM310]|uniref:Uncharacterized protein n=1 Tax=Trametes coccinea (strain BRFM310) TaxID=1353009 RepID=A0A1Y2IIU6_TRAC3|nr:hypothetical protein PYCCODRAFT_571040 [Trametes coccinea BRFM310]
MSTIDNLCQSIGLCFSCCCIGCNEASGLFCFYKSCSCCSRRKMDDNEFEREVEELYASKLKDGTTGAPQTLELQQRTSPTGVSDGTTRVGANGGVDTQPGRRPSMDVPRRSGERAAQEGDPGEGEGQKNPSEARAERKERTREWVHAHSVSEPGVKTAAREPQTEDDAATDAPREREHQRSKSHTPSGSVRSRGRGGQPAAAAAGTTSDAQAYLNAVEQSWRRSEDNDRARAAAATPAESQPEPDAGVPATSASSSPPRLDIPAMLRPGRPLSYGAPPSHAMPPAAGEAAGLGSEGARVS